MKQIFLLTILTLAFAVSASAQTEEPTVTIKQTTADACARAIDEAQASRTAIASLQAENEALRRLDAINRQLDAKRLEVLAGYEKLVELLERRKPKKCFISIFHC